MDRKSMIEWLEAKIESLGERLGSLGERLDILMEKPNKCFPSFMIDEMVNLAWKFNHKYLLYNAVLVNLKEDDENGKPETSEIIDDMMKALGTDISKFKKHKKYQSTKEKWLVATNIEALEEMLKEVKELKAA